MPTKPWKRTIIDSWTRWHRTSQQDAAIGFIIGRQALEHSFATIERFARIAARSNGTSVQRPTSVQTRRTQNTRRSAVDHLFSSCSDPGMRIGRRRFGSEAWRLLRVAVGLVRYRAGARSRNTASREVWNWASQTTLGSSPKPLTHPSSGCFTSQPDLRQTNAVDPDIEPAARRNGSRDCGGTARKS